MKEFIPSYPNPSTQLGASELTMNQSLAHQISSFMNLSADNDKAA
ncbi:MAG: hypothetical protein BTN85_1504 [Candidatus Methanohalarchaeum thermophilum]|uniref:Uncharacterized protein n=1 Tax=Methanohalarchaeum thermophilum TaxID=1903181 RepID=A0A1Q6DXD3_METT1|nr:MAG: hypothetical protein BTN85_1504 [Candidatus Methanohalarchaeum thermophilum]